MLYAVGKKTYIQCIDVRFIKEKLPKYPDTLRSESFLSIDEKELDNKKFEFVEVTQSANIDWLYKQKSWLLIEAEHTRKKIGELEETIDVLKDGCNKLFDGIPEENLTNEDLLDKAKTTFKIEAMEALLDNRKGVFCFHYPVPEPEPAPKKPKPRNRFVALFHRS